MTTVRFRCPDCYTSPAVSPLDCHTMGMVLSVTCPDCWATVAVELQLHELVGLVVARGRAEDEWAAAIGGLEFPADLVGAP